MIEILTILLPIIIYGLITILIIIGIILGIRIIIMADNMNRLLNDVKNKTETINKLCAIFYNASSILENTLSYGTKILRKEYK